MLAFECVIQVIAWMGYVPSYEDTPLFYKQVGIPIFIPTSIYVVYCYYEFQIELEEKRLEIDSQPARIEPVFTQSLDNGVSTLDGDSRARLIEDIRRD